MIQWQFFVVIQFCAESEYRFDQSDLVLAFTVNQRYNKRH